MVELNSGVFRRLQGNVGKRDGMPQALIKGTRLFYQDRGRGEPIVFLHCWATNSSLWRHQLDYFSKNHRCIATDYFGHGRTGGTYRSYHPEVFATHLRELLKKLKLGDKRPVLVGHSLGGMVAMCYTLKYPERVRAMVLTDTTPGLMGFPEQGIAALLAAPFVLLSTPLFRGMAAAVTAMHPFASPLKRIEMIWHTRQPSNLAATRTLMDFTRFNVTRRLLEIEAPTLIINGSLDVYTDIRHSLLLHLLLRNSKLEIVKFSGHTAPMENPGEFNRKMDDFIKMHA